MREEYKYAGKVMQLKKSINLPNIEKATSIAIEDYCENVLGCPWMTANVNLAALVFAFRAAKARLPIDNNVLYGKIGSLGCVVHESELVIPNETLNDG